MAARFEIKRKWRPFGVRYTFSLWGANGERLLPPEPYVSRANALRGIADLRDAVASAEIDES